VFKSFWGEPELIGREPLLADIALEPRLGENCLLPPLCCLGVLILTSADDGRGRCNGCHEHETVGYIVGDPKLWLRKRHLSYWFRTTCNVKLDNVRVPALILYPIIFLFFIRLLVLLLEKPQKHHCSLLIIFLFATSSIHLHRLLIVFFLHQYLLCA
jgi:hypothetical protein